MPWSSKTPPACHRGDNTGVSQASAWCNVSVVQASPDGVGSDCAVAVRLYLPPQLPSQHAGWAVH